MTPKAAKQGTLDFDYHRPDSDVEIGDGWRMGKNPVCGVPKEWLDAASE